MSKAVKAEKDWCNAG